MFVSLSVEIGVDVEGLGTGDVRWSKNEHITAGKGDEDNEETVLEERSLLPIPIIVFVLYDIVNYNCSDHENCQNVDDEHLHDDSCFGVLILCSQFVKCGSESPKDPHKNNNIAKIVWHLTQVECSVVHASTFLPMFINSRKDQADCVDKHHNSNIDMLITG